MAPRFKEAFDFRALQSAIEFSRRENLTDPAETLGFHFNSSLVVVSQLFLASLSIRTLTEQ